METLLSKKSKNPETMPLNVVCQWNIFSNSGVFYIFSGKILEKAIQC